MSLSRDGTLQRTGASCAAEMELNLADLGTLRYLNLADLGTLRHLPSWMDLADLGTLRHLPPWRKPPTTPEPPPKPAQELTQFPFGKGLSLIEMKRLRTLRRKDASIGSSSTTKISEEISQDLVRQQTVHDMPLPSQKSIFLSNRIGKSESNLTSPMIYAKDRELLYSYTSKDIDDSHISTVLGHMANKSSYKDYNPDLCSEFPLQKTMIDPSLINSNKLNNFTQKHSTSHRQVPNHHLKQYLENFSSSKNEQSSQPYETEDQRATPCEPHVQRRQMYSQKRALSQPNACNNSHKEASFNGNSYNTVDLGTSSHGYEQSIVRETVRSASSHPAHQGSIIRLSSPAPTQGPSSNLPSPVSNQGPLSNLSDTLSRMSASSGYSSSSSSSYGSFRSSISIPPVLQML